MLGVLDSGHGCIEPFFVGAVTGFTDITREDAAWHPIFDMIRPILDMVKRPSFDLHYNHEVFIPVKRLVPWRLTKVQISRAPKANRLHSALERLESPHRAAILLYNDGTIEYQVEKLADVPGSHQRFRRPVAFAIFVHGQAPDAQGEVGPGELEISYGGRKARVSDEIWFEGLGPEISKAIQSAGGRLHQNMGHPPEPVMLRNVAFAGGGRDTLVAIKALRCSVCLRNRARRAPLRPAKTVVLRVFGGAVPGCILCRRRSARALRDPWDDR